MTTNLLIAATITSVLSLLIIGGMLLTRTPQNERRLLVLLVLLMLPMNPLTFWLVRMPLDVILLELFGKQSDLLRYIRTLYAPLTEEPAKLWLLLIPWFYQRIKSTPIHRVALAIGLGFGVGEAWTVAILLSKSPEMANYPWYMLRGYMGERMMVCIIHAGFTATAIWFIVYKKRIAAGLLVCMFLHFLANFPIFFARNNDWGISANIWNIVLLLWVALCFVAMGALLAYMAYGNHWLQKLILGRVRCPECGEIYAHRLFSINLFSKCYERCPHCKHWHLVSAFDEEKACEERVPGDNHE